MPSICIVNPHYIKETIGGAEVQLYLLAKACIGAGWTVHYVTGDVDEEGEEDGIRLIPFRERGRGFSKNFSILKTLLLDIDADLYVQRGRKLDTALVGRFAEATERRFAFFTSMDIDTMRYKNMVRLKGSRADFLKRLTLGLPALREDRRTLAGIKAADVVFCQTRFQQEQLRRNVGIDSELFPNMLPVPAEKKIHKKDPPVVLWLASLKAWKRPELFMHMAQRLESLPCRFVLAGRVTNPRFQAALFDLQKRQKNFEFVDRVSFKKSGELIARAGLFVNTSMGYEGFPNTFIQAWMRKTPVVSLEFDPDGLLVDKKIGFCSGTYEQMCVDVETLVSDPSLREEMGGRARAFAADAFGLEKRFPRLLERFEMMIE